MTTQFPTLVFLAGAFADPSCFDPLTSRLHKAGYPFVYASVPSLNPSSPGDSSTAQDSAHVRSNVLLPLLEKGNDIIVVVHSYGGVVGGAAATGLSKAERHAVGKNSGILGLLYIAGNIVGNGQCLLEAVGGAYPPFIIENHPQSDLAVIKPVMQTLYNDVDASRSAELEKGMIPHALLAFQTPSGPPAWAEKAFEGRIGYIKTLDDQCNPLFIQELWIKNSGADWDTVEIKSSHCPFISQPEKLAELCVPFFQKWMS